MGFLMERRSPTKSYAAHVSLGDYTIMTQDERKNSKFIQIVKHYSKPATIAPDFVGNWNHQPPMCKHEDKALARRIRSQVKPFAQGPTGPELNPTGVNPAANM